MNAPILVLGASGMLGHKMFQVLRARFPATYGTLRGHRTDPSLDRVTLLQDDRIFEGIDVQDQVALMSLLSEIRPVAIVNCVGVIKQRADAQAAIPSITINSLLPHWLAAAAESWGGRVIHFSTDCVFSGRDGGYTEDSFSDAEDLYGRTKYLGEVAYPNSLTLRTSIIGRELTQHRSLLDWFLAQNHRTINGFTRHYYTGLTTNYLAGLVADLIAEQPNLSGVYQVASEKISKYALLQLLRDAYELDVNILPEDAPFCDRSLKGDRFVNDTGYTCPPWPELVQQLASDPTPYVEWLGDRAPGGR
jgi:dTDP-4-dehydrorhamnose reductase